MAVKRAIAIAISGAAVVVATACSSSTNVGTSLDDEELEQRLSTLLEEQTGQKPDKVDCPDDLEAKEGSTTQCTFNAGGNHRGVTVTVAELDGTTVRFNAEVN